MTSARLILMLIPEHFSWCLQPLGLFVVKRLGANKLGALRVQTGDPIAQAFATGVLRAGHAHEVTPSAEVARPALGLVNVHKVLKVSNRQKPKPVCKHRTTNVFAENLTKRGSSRPSSCRRASKRLNQK